MTRRLKVNTVAGIMRPMSREGRFTLVTAVFYGVLGAGCVMWGLLSDGVTLAWWESGTLVWTAWGVGLALVVIVFSAVSVRRFVWAKVLADLLTEALGRPGPGQIAVLAAASAVVEELLFRGCLLQETGLVFSSLLFGALHGFFLPRYLAWSLFALALGLVWGIMVLSCGALVPVMVSHFLVNLVNLRLLGSHQREET